jgi:hypothetical protein
MKMLTCALRGALAFFVDDGALALGLVVVVVLAALCAALIPENHLAAGAILLAGCLAVLFVNTVGTTRR